MRRRFSRVAVALTAVAAVAIACVYPGLEDDNGSSSSTANNPPAENEPRRRRRKESEEPESNKGPPTTPEREALREQIDELDRIASKIDNHDVRNRLRAVKDALAAIMRGDKT